MRILSSLFEMYGDMTGLRINSRIFGCQNLKRPLKQLKTQWFLKTSKRVSSLRHDLQEIQHYTMHGECRDDLLQEQKKLMAELEKWSKIEEQI